MVIIIMLTNIYLLQVNNKNNRAKFEICFKLTKNTKIASNNVVVFIVKFKHISNLSL